MFVPDFFGQALNGLSYGVLLFLLSVGLTLIFGMLDVVNLAHGSFYMLGVSLIIRRRMQSFAPVTKPAISVK